MMLNILEATIIVDQADLVLLKTELPSAEYPFTNQLVVKFNAASGTGAAYVRDHFKIEPKVIEVPKQ